MNKPKEPTLEQVEKAVLESAKFVGVLLQEIRKENAECLERFGITYSKFVGLGAPYDEAIRDIRKVKITLDSRLLRVRECLAEKYREQ